VAAEVGFSRSLTLEFWVQKKLRKALGVKKTAGRKTVTQAEVFFVNHLRKDEVDTKSFSF